MRFSLSPRGMINPKSRYDSKKDGFIGERAFVLPPACVAELESHPLGAQLHFTDIGYYPAADNHCRQRDVPISQWVQIYCRSGRGWYSVDGKHYDVRSNHYFVLPAGRPHAYGADDSDPWTIYWIHYKGSLASLFAPPTIAPTLLNSDANSRISNRIELFEEIMTTLERGYSHESLIYSCATLIYFLSTLKQVDRYRAAGMTAGDMAGRDKSSRVDAVIGYMTENIEQPLRLTDMAAHVHVSPCYLSHLFASHTGQSPMKYLKQLRIRHACQLLDFTSLHINQICHKVGVADPYYFSRLFTSIMGISPTEYRRRPKG